MRRQLRPYRAALAAALLLFGCENILGIDGNIVTDGGLGGTGGAPTGGMTGSTTTTSIPTADPPPPALGPQIDRMGRPLSNLAFNHTFDTKPEQKDLAKDAWNANGDPSKWASYIAEIEVNLAMLDGFDTVCGNQLLADMTKSDPSRYATLATIFSDDRLYINMVGATCTTYLGVEANAIGVTNTDCGGRRLSYDVIDHSYTILMAGKLDSSIGDDVGISEAATGQVFPDLDEPH